MKPPSATTKPSEKRVYVRYQADQFCVVRFGACSPDIFSIRQGIRPVNFYLWCISFTVDVDDARQIEYNEDIKRANHNSRIRQVSSSD